MSRDPVPPPPMKRPKLSNDPGGWSQSHEAVRILLRDLGEDPKREGLLDTPKRVVKAWREMTIGYEQDPKEILHRDFEAHKYDQIIGCPWIEFHSTCEHHMLPFTGFAHVAYLPSKTKARVVGLSKLGRLVDCFARRFQIQEQLTMQIADAMEQHLRPRGVAVVITAKHLCMACRGVQKQRSVMVTSAMRGVFRREASARSEFFQLVELASKNNG